MNQPDAPRALLALNPALDRAEIAARFARDGRVQIRSVLTEAAARTTHDVLRHTPWGIAWQADGDGPHMVRAGALPQVPAAEQGRVGQAIGTAMTGRGYAFLFSQYPMLEAYLKKWAPGGPHDLLLEHLNDAPFLDFVRGVTGIPELVKADAQATLYRPNQFLSEHDDAHAGESRRVAYVLNLCAVDWRPDWGGYLNFYDADGDVKAGFRPRFNALNLFRVPQRHNVTYVPPFAPLERFAITGWFRDR
ncbi:2OG-Fe(II) oxygenase [Sphingomonas prati]|uniref:Prolyl 3,4-dihydroxylase TPA1/OFD1 N-terminal domain-containing protein n=1 Tax=Sphingomonas prati TaxID=1843237 RepID=A0A7W9BRP7_9SPHN|nr:2OG-Fe(II) oxygenase family protein [Sphingomonas prati]MBB5728785.1 hypothetical protein [Sphingomonas prati]GGE87571.1 proline hydroxylase [Sphingomonas prati]